MQERDIFVDLDGTLVRTDLFAECIIKFIKSSPLNLFRFAAWFSNGRAVAKAMIARNVAIDPAQLPYESKLVDYLRDQKVKGRRIVLATASHWLQAKKVASYLGIFDDVIASNAKCNLKGSRKLERIRRMMGERPFTYAGDSRADRPIWRAAASAILVNAPRRDVKKAERHGTAEWVLTSRRATPLAFLKEMRPHQWAKNALILVPLFTSHHYFDFNAARAALLAFVSFSICASGVYFLNDLLDLEADRRHEKKRFRPLPSGDLSLKAGALGAMILPLFAFVLAAVALPRSFLIVLAIYYLTANVYSFYVKRVSTADVLTLAVLYTLRVVAGAVAIGVSLSSWLLAFSVFLFVSLAYLKRYIETAALEEAAGHAPGRGYSANDSETMFTLGIANATASVVVLSLFISSDEVRQQYAGPDILWLLCMLVLYWNNRIWVGARRGKINDDPLVFAVRDRVSQLIGVACVVVVIAARYIVI